MASHILRHHFQVFLVWNLDWVLVGFVNQPHIPSSLFVCFLGLWPHFSFNCLWCRAKPVSDLILRVHLKPSNLSPGSSHLVYRKQCYFFESRKVGFVPLFRMCISVPMKKSSRLSLLELMSVLPHTSWWEFASQPRRSSVFHMCH